MSGSTTLAASLSKDISGFRGVQDGVLSHRKWTHASSLKQELRLYCRISNCTAKLRRCSHTVCRAGRIFFPQASGQPQDREPLILYPIAARLGIGDALLLLIANRNSAEESRTAGFAGKQLALTVHQNSSLDCATAQDQGEGKKKYRSHKLERIYRLQASVTNGLSCSNHSPMLP